MIKGFNKSINILEELENDFFYLKQTWEEYKTIFSNKESIEDINKYCGSCFYTIQLSMNNDIILTISRLLDNAKTGRNENLVLEKLLEFVSNDNDKSVLLAKIDCIRNIRDLCKLKELRNKRLSHRDSEQSSSFLLINYDCIEKIIRMIEDFFIFFRDKNRLEYIVYDHFAIPPDCKNLIIAIKYFNENYMKDN